MGATTPDDLVPNTQRRGAAAALLTDAVLLVDGQADEMTVRFGTLTSHGLDRAAFIPALDHAVAFDAPSAGRADDEAPPADPASRR